MSKIIEVEHLKKYFKEVKAVDDISFPTKRGGSQNLRLPSW